MHLSSLRGLVAALMLLIAIPLWVQPVLGAAHDILVVRGDDDFPPYAYLDNGVPTGFSVDVMRAVAEVMGIAIKIDLGPWKEVRRQIEHGQTLVLAGMFASPERQKLVDFTTPHVIITPTLFVREGSPLRSLDDLERIEHPSIIVQYGDIMHDFVKTKFPDANIVVVKRLDEVLPLLASSSYDAALQARLQGLSVARREGLENIKAVGPPLASYRFCFGVAKSHTELLAQLNEGLTIIHDNGTYQEIHDKWFGVFDEGAINDRALLLGVGVLSVLGLALAASLLWSRSLKRKVREKTLALETELTERLRAEQELSASRKRFEAMVQESPLGLTITDLDGRFLLSNKTFDEMFGYSIDDVPDVSSWMDRAYPSRRYRAFVERAWNKDAGSIISGKRRFMTKTFKVTCNDGTVKDIEFRVTRVGEDLMVLFADVTERLRTEEALVQTEKMMSLGGMASGMAHEINNPLGGILQGVQNVIRRFSPGLPANKRAADKAGLDLKALASYLEDRKIGTMLQGIKTSGERAAEVVSAMLTFSNTSDSRRAPCSLEALIDKAVEMAGTEYNLTRRYDFRNISIKRDFAKGMPLVPCTETEIVQVFLNILRNAAQALCDNDPQAAPPRLSIVIRRDDNHAVVRFADNGAGMPGSVAKRIFEPFFTTREPGEGTGLGLSVSYFIITRNHGGSIAVSSEPGQGTTISIRLPIGEADDDDQDDVGNSEGGNGDDNGDAEHGSA